MERKILPILVILSAAMVSISAAVYSVTGLGKMFGGASLEVMIMTGSLEIAKLVVASLLYQYWDILGKILKLYLTIAVGVLMIITSGGIYGFLSAAYSETSNKLEVINKNVAVYDLKKARYQVQLEDVGAEKQFLVESIKELSKGLANNVIQYKDAEGNIITTTSSSTRKVLERQLNDSKAQRDNLYLREEALTDSITSIEIFKLNMETNADVAAEIGPLKYIAELTNKSIDQVVNWVIIALMIVFDPLAIALVIAANTIFYNSKQPNIMQDDLPHDIPNVINEEWDEEDALDQVLNSMIEDTDEEVPLNNEEPPVPEPPKPASSNRSRSVSSY